MIRYKIIIFTILFLGGQGLITSFSSAQTKITPLNLISCRILNLSIMSNYKYHTVYLTTNLINGKKYLGKHSTNKIDDRYLGSGVLLLKAINKYGRKNFKKETLFVFGLEKDAYKKESELALILKVRTNSNFYNLTDCGEGNNYWQGKKRSPETIQKLIDSHIGQKAWNKGLPKEQQPNFGKKPSEETCKKIGNSNRGKKVSEETIQKLIDSHIGQKAWNKGIVGVFKASDETKAKQSRSKKGKGVKPILQFSKDGKFIKEWIGVNYTREGGFSPSKVSLCCNNKRPHHRGFVWKFKD
jgi:group I intron endonuclease